MAYKDLQDFINHLKQKKLLDEIEVEVDSELEITEIADRVSKKFGNALLFKKVKNFKYPVLINSLGTYQRMNYGLEVENLDDIAATIMDFMDATNYIITINKDKSIPKLTRLDRVFPKKVKNAPCQR